MTMNSLQKIADLSRHQRQFLSDSSDHKILAAGRQFGKTTLLLKEADYAAGKGLSVAFITTSVMRARDVKSRMAREQFFSDPSVWKRDLRTLTEYHTGGFIEFLSSQRMNQYKRFDYDLVIVDEVSHCTAGVIALIKDIASKGAKVYLATTPIGSSMPIVKKFQNAGFKLFVGPTQANPVVDTDYLEEMRSQYTDEEFRAKFMSTHHFLGDHCLFITSAGNKSEVTCLQCGMDEEIPTDVEPEKQVLLKKWVFGKALDTACA